MVHGAVLPEHVYVADQPLAFLADVIGVAGQFAAAPQSVTAERLHVDKAAHQLGRSAEVPIELIPPGGDLFVERGSETFSGNGPEIDQRRVVPVRRGGHTFIVTLARLSGSQSPPGAEFQRNRDGPEAAKAIG